MKSYIYEVIYIVFWYETAKSAKLIWFFLLWALADLARCYVNNDTLFLCSPDTVFISTCCHSLGVYFVTQSFLKISRFNINILPDTHEMPCLRSFPVAGQEEGCSWSVTQTVNIWLQRNVRIKDFDNETHCFSDTQAALVHCCVLSTEAFSLYLSRLVSQSFTQTETPHRLIDGLEPQPLPCYRLSLLSGWKTKDAIFFLKQTVSLWNTSWSTRDAADPMSRWDQMLPRHLAVHYKWCR